MRKNIIYIPGMDPRGSKYYSNLFVNELRKYSDKTSNSINIESYQCGLNIQTSTTKTNIFFLDWTNIINCIYFGSKIKLWFITIIACLAWAINFFRIKNNIFFSFFILFLSFEFISILNMLLITFILLFKGSYLVFVCVLFIPIIKVHFFLRKKISNNKVKHLSQCVVAMLAYAFLRKKKFIEWAKLKVSVIESSQKNSFDEIIIMAHSSGTIPLIYLLNELPQNLLENIKIVTTGGYIPLYINFFFFTRINKNVLYKVKYSKLKWFDIYSPVDLLSIKLENNTEFKDAGVKSYNGQFYKMYDNADDYSRAKKKMFVLHKNYLLCGDNPANRFNLYKIFIAKKCLEEL